MRAGVKIMRLSTSANKCEIPMAEEKLQRTAGDQKTKSILFVDDEPNLLGGIKRSLRSQRRVWDMRFAASGIEALHLMEETEFDAVVTDMRMPGMNGAELLREVAGRQPLATRIVLSGHSEEASILSLVGTTHKYLSKPCEVETLKTALNRSFALQELLRKEPLQALVSSLDSLPTLPSVYQALTRKLRSADVTMREIGQLIAEDPPITAKLLQLVNSAFFGVGRRITNPEEAAVLLGMDTLKGLVLNAGIFRQCELPQREEFRETLEYLWQHSIKVGRLARDIAEAEGCDKATIDDALAAGLLHNIGKLLMVCHLPSAWLHIQQLIESEALAPPVAEEQTTGATHNAIGAYLLGLWGLPEAIVEAVAFTHAPLLSPDRSFGALAAVHAADGLLTGEGDIDRDFCEALGLESRLDVWRSLADALPEIVGL